MLFFIPILGQFRVIKGFSLTNKTEGEWGGGGQGADIKKYEKHAGVFNYDKEKFIQFMLL